MVFTTGHETFTYQKLDMTIEILCAHKKKPHTNTTTTKQYSIKTHIQTQQQHNMIVLVSGRDNSQAS